MATGIYKIRNIINGNIYIGSAVNINGRWSQHISRLKMRKHHSNHLQNAWNKYGSDAFEFLVIEECEVSKLIEREQYFIDTLSPKYNICRTAGSPLGIKHSTETRAKISEVRKGVKHSTETRAKMSEAKKGKPTWNKGITGISEETRAKRSAALKGKPSWNKGKTWSKSKKGKPHSAETRARISAGVKNWLSKNK